LQEPDGRTLLPHRLAEFGLEGPDIGRLRAEGSFRHHDRTVSIDDVSVAKHGQVFAFVMDTRWCDGALELASGADLLVCEATFLSSEAELAERYGHLTAQQAGRLAQEAGVRRLVLSHFSRRYPDPARFGQEASAEFDGDVIVADDFERIAVPSRP
jgi:ribonuclease Z